MRPSALLLCSLLFAGCLDSTAEDVKENGVVSLDDLRDCRFQYPDLSPVDCALSFATEIRGEIPTGWSCIHDTDVGNVRYALWSDHLGHYGMEYETSWPGKKYGRATFSANSEAETIVFEGPDRNFVRFAGQWVSDPFDLTSQTLYRLELSSFEAHGTSAVFGPDALDMAVSDFEGNLWFVWRFHGPNATYYLQQMNNITQTLVESQPPQEYWVPMTFNLTGTDFWVETFATFLLAPGLSGASIQAARGGC